MTGAHERRLFAIHEHPVTGHSPPTDS
ncbi:MAG: hypothetical protein J07HX64_00664 [halophilic archaeon J07HX64]|nr:MAG: hypothetical protein J07HX64_00664 [halophilic archaeon J07HX64]